MKKMLMLASVASMIDQFNMYNIKILCELGYEVHVAANFEYGNTSSEERVDEFKRELIGLGISYYQIDFARNVSKVAVNIRAYRQIVELIKKNKYEFIHCHSPIGGVCGRIAAYKTHTKVIYTAHGFHFFNGAPKKNWLLYYPVEKFFSKYTDVMIVINQEDYDRTVNFMKAKKNYYIPGVGIDIKNFTNLCIDRNEKRRQLGLTDDEIMLLSVGELNKNKNHEVIIRAMAKIKNIKIQYFIAGTGMLNEYLTNIAVELGINDNVHLLGYRKDINELDKAADIFCFPSHREGLGLAAVEALAMGLPLITSNIHGINDYSVNELTGYSCNPNDIEGFAKVIYKLSKDTKKRNEIKKYNVNEAKKFDVGNVNKIMRDVYKELS